MVTRLEPRTSRGEGWLSEEESGFLEQLIRDPKMTRLLFTPEPVKLRYPSRYEGNYQDYTMDVASQFQEIKQTLRRLMLKSPYMLRDNQRAYAILDDRYVPLGELTIGSRIVMGYKLLLLRPKYDVGEYKSLVELVFPYPVKILPVGPSHYIMDENHIFVLTGMERRPLPEHPSHGIAYHIDLFRLVCTPDTDIPKTGRISDAEEKSRIHLMIDNDDKGKMIVSKRFWIKEDDGNQLKDRRDKQRQDKDLERFKEEISSTKARFTDATIMSLYKLSRHGLRSGRIPLKEPVKGDLQMKPDIVNKILFSVHTHSLKLSQIVRSFSTDIPKDTPYLDLENQMNDAVKEISSELDKYFTEDATVSTERTTLYTVTSSKHFSSLENEIGSFIKFDNYLVGYTSSDSISYHIGMRANSVILGLTIPPKMPVLVLPEHTNRSKYHRCVVLPRNTVWQLEEIRSIAVLSSPRTYRKFYNLRLRRVIKPKEGDQELTGKHIVQIEPSVIKGISKM